VDGIGSYAGQTTQLLSGLISGNRWIDTTVFNRNSPLGS
jgi:hypothetical protein